MTRRIILNEALSEKTRVFRDREHAGTVLAELLRAYRSSVACVLGIAAGGVPVAAALADCLGLPLDVAVVSKITLPGNPEAGYGAVAFDGSVKLNETLIDRLGLKELQLQAGIAKTKARVKRRLERIRGDTSYSYLQGATALLVDDGLASGFTMLTGIDALENSGAGEIIVAVPTASRSALDRVAPQVSGLYCANLRTDLPFAVADAYQCWVDVEEEQLARFVSELGKERG